MSYFDRNNKLLSNVIPLTLIEPGADRVNPTIFSSLKEPFTWVMFCLVWFCYFVYFVSELLPAEKCFIRSKRDASLSLLVLRRRG